MAPKTGYIEGDVMMDGSIFTFHRNPLSDDDLAFKLKDKLGI